MPLRPFIRRACFIRRRFGSIRPRKAIFNRRFNCRRIARPADSGISDGVTWPTRRLPRIWRFLSISHYRPPAKAHLSLRSEVVILPPLDEEGWIRRAVKPGRFHPFMIDQGRMAR